MFIHFDTNTLLITCNNHVKLYIISQIRRGAIHIVDILQKNINIFLKHSDRDLKRFINCKKNDTFNSKQDETRIKCQKIYLCKLKIYNLCILTIIDFIEVHGNPILMIKDECRINKIYIFKLESS